MRKKLPLIIAVILVVISLFMLSACNRDEAKTPPSDISRVTLSYLAGESDLAAVSLERGEREKQFIADGKVTNVMPFCELKIVPLVKNDVECAKYALAGEGKTFEGEISDPAHGEFCAAIDLDFVPDKITVTLNDDVSEIDLLNVLEGGISCADAITIARDVFKDKLEAEKAEGKTREVYAKLITGDRTTYYFYVSFIGEGVDYWATLIDLSGKQISKRS